MERYFVKDSQKKILSKAISENLCLDVPLGFKTYRNARILPQRSPYLSGGVCDERGVYVKTTSFVENLYDGSYVFGEDEVVIRHKDAVFLGTWYPVYGHAITDNIKRLWFLYSEDYKKLKEAAAAQGRDIDLVYVYLRGGLELAVYNKDILRASGIDSDSLIRIKEVTQYDNVYIPDSSLIPGENCLRFYTKEFRFIVDMICRNCNVDGPFPEKVYLTRTGIKDGKDFGEKTLERLFERRGYSVVSPEKMTFEQQVALMQHCRSVVSTEGSIAHNALFCKDGTELVILRKTDPFNEYTNLVNGVKNLNFKYIEANHTKIARVTW